MTAVRPRCPEMNMWVIIFYFLIFPSYNIEFAQDRKSKNILFFIAFLIAL